MSKIQEIIPPKHPYEKHLFCVILGDGSGSMSGKPMEELNEGLKDFGKALQDDTMAQGRVDVSVLSFADTVKTEVGFRPAEEYEAPTLTAGGLTSFNEALNTALDILEARKEECRQLGINYYRPWLFVMTDGYPTDGHLEAATRERMQRFIANRKVNYIPMGIGNANIAHLQSYYPEDAQQKPVLKASCNDFKDAFLWLSSSVISASQSDPTSGTIESAPLPQETITLVL